ncbi:TlpA family protein disulfide reductase [Pedobacter changchengzhani]|uniref:TlpA family protein disulfide reductase n=1 Tax=Pedobacter changchengzhani TaxID=2529274 RepID=A0A4R5MQ85_9SPHI|nr:TlpA family protein disulfide reductase [Pedobacter changchengzhani]
MKFLKKNIVNTILLVLFAVLFFVPDAKAFVLKGFINIGLFSPDIKEEKTVVPDLDGIKFKNAKGEIVDLGELKGKVVFLNFWATWCPPCRAEMPSINKLYTQFKDDADVVFIFVDGDGDLPKANAFMKARNYQMPVFKAESNVPNQIFSGSLPTTVIFDKQGRISLKHEGMADYSSKKIIDFLMKLKAG